MYTCTLVIKDKYRVQNRFVSDFRGHTISAQLTVVHTSFEGAWKREQENDSIGLIWVCESGSFVEEAKCQGVKVSLEVNKGHLVGLIEEGQRV